MSSWWPGRTVVGSIFVMLLVGACVAEGQAQKARPAEVSRSHADRLAARADSFRTRRDVDDALQAYRRARSQYRRLGDRERVAAMTGDIGVMQYLKGRYDDALRHFRRARALAREVGDQKEEVANVNNIGLVHKSRGQYGAALRRYRAALETYQSIGDTVGVGISLNNIGDIFKKRGQYDKALPPLRASLRIHRRHDDSLRIAIALTNLGLVQTRRGKYESARARHREALRIYRGLGNRAGKANALNNLGIVSKQQGADDKALARFHKALQLNQDLGNEGQAAIIQNNIGTIHEAQGRAQTALTHYQQAASTNRSLGRRDRLARNLENIGTLHLAAERHRVADSALSASVELTETLLKHATGEDRRDFLAKQSNRFQTLALARVQDGRPKAGLRAYERGRAHVLARAVGENRLLRRASQGPPSIDSLQAAVGPGEAALLYANVESPWPIVVFLVTGDRIQARAIPDSAYVYDITKRFEAALAHFQQQAEIGTMPDAAVIRQSGSAGLRRRAAGDLETLVQLYRHDVSMPSDQQVMAPERRDQLGRHLRHLLVGTVENQLAGIDELIVVPSGPLGHLPFEALQDWDGTPLIAQRNVRYAQSLRVLRLLRRRRARVPLSSDSLLALGGAVYRRGADTTATLPNTPTTDARAGADSVGNTSSSNSTVLEDTVPSVLGDTIDGQVGPAAKYRRLGYGPNRWSSLSGTLREVQGLRRIAAPQVTLLTGPRASERTMRQWARTGRLRHYRALHVATHGLVLPDRPSLSALVLSDVTRPGGARIRFKTSDHGRIDGYLNAREIASLDLNAEFVALSACRTGLGRVYRGSGVVSLAQPFLQAGADATAVSLWAVYDASTSRFMRAVYRRAWNRDTSWADAIATTKRAFAAGDYGERLRDPRFWAPLVHYGYERE